MKDISFLIGSKIKEIRKKQGLTQGQLAQKINVDPKYISRLETGSSTPSISTVTKIADALNAEISQFFIIERKEKKNQIIDSIVQKLANANLKQLSAIFEIVNVVVEK